jgi:hypothetical protein
VIHVTLPSRTRSTSPVSFADQPSPHDRGVGLVLRPAFAEHYIPIHLDFDAIDRRTTA